MKSMKLTAANCLLTGLEWIKPCYCVMVLLCLIFGTLTWVVTGNLDTAFTRVGLIGLWTAIPIWKGCEYVEKMCVNNMDLTYNYRAGGYVYRRNEAE